MFYFLWLKSKEWLCNNRKEIRIWTSRFRALWPTVCTQTGLPGGSDDKESACNAGDPGSIPGSGISPGEGNCNPLQYSGLENPMEGEAWWVTVHGVAKTQKWLCNEHFLFLHVTLSMRDTGASVNFQVKETTQKVLNDEAWVLDIHQYIYGSFNVSRSWIMDTMWTNIFLNFVCRNRPGGSPWNCKTL